MKAGSSYFDIAGRKDILGGGSRMIPVNTPKGRFRVWTKRIGNNPRIKVLLLHGGPGSTHEYLEACDSFFPAAGIEYYYYDQLGSAFSDQPDEPELWDLGRFVDELEQVRLALGLDESNLYLYGQSWGGILAIEYALKYPHNLRALIISNMMSSIPAYNDYARDFLMPQMDQAILREIKELEDAGRYEEPRYMDLLMPNFYLHHILRMPVDTWPDPVNRAFARINHKVYVPMQGPSELGARGRLLGWDRSEQLGAISVPTLTIGATFDTMDPAHMEMMAGRFPRGRYHHCPQGSHLALYDDQATYFEGLLRFIEDVDRGRL